MCLEGCWPRDVKEARRLPGLLILEGFSYSALASLASALFLVLYFFRYSLIRRLWSSHIIVLWPDTGSSQSRQMPSSLRFWAVSRGFPSAALLLAKLRLACSLSLSAQVWHRLFPSLAGVLLQLVHFPSSRSWRYRSLDLSMHPWQRSLPLAIFSFRHSLQRPSSRSC